MKKIKARKPGEVVEEFDVKKNGKNLHIMFRYPKLSDIDQVLSCINCVIAESEFLRLNKRLTKKEELKWLRDCIKGVREGKKVMLVAEINGRISGLGNVDSAGGAGAHVGNLGISLREKYTGMGIGTRLMEALMSEAMRIGIEVVKLSHYENNIRAKHVYEKLGFKHVGVIPKARKNKDGTYGNESIMYKVLV